MGKKRISKFAKTTPGADVILTIDPASVSNAGLCLRECAEAKLWTPTTNKPRTPYWYVSSSVWNTAMHDDLGRVLSLTVPRGGRVCYAATATAFKGAAWDLGRAVGCIEGLLHDLNVYPDDERVVEVNDSTWRSKIFTKKERETVAALATPVLRRAAWKQLAVDTVARKYRVEVDDNAAEAILLNDYIAIYREATYAAVPL